MVSAVIGALRVALGIDSAEFSAGAARVEKRSAKMGETIQRNIGAGMDRAVGSLKAFATAYLSLEGAKKFLEYADAAKNMDAQLKLATASFGSMAIAQADVNRIANETRSGLVETASLYSGFTRAASANGKAQSEAAQATETFSKALKIGGAGTAQVASATLQLNQALSSTTPQWEELGQVFEASPRVQKLIADSLGVTTSQLKALVSEGKVSGKQLFESFTKLNLTKEIDAEFKQLPVTFDQAMTLVNNAAIATIGAFDNGGQFSTAIANFITQGTGGFADLSEAATQFGIDTRAASDAFDHLFDPLLKNGESVFDALGFRVATFQQQIYNLLSGIDQIRNIPIDINNQMAAFDRKYLSKVPGYDVQKSVQRSDLAGQFRDNFRSRQRELRAGVDQRRASAAVNNGPGKANPATVSDADAKKAAAAAKKAAADAKRLAAERQRAAEKAARDEQRYQQDLARAQDEQLRGQLDLTVDQTERVNIQQALLDNERAARLSEIATNNDLTAAQKKRLSGLIEEISADQARLLHREDQEKLARLALDKAQAQTDNETDILDAQAGLARTAKERGAIERQILDKQFDMLRLVQQSALDQAQRNGDTQGAELARQRLGTLDTLQRLGQARVTRDNQGPLGSYLNSLPQTADELNEAFEGVAAGGLQSVIDGLGDVATGAKSLADIFDDVANDIIRSLIKIGLQKGIGALFGSLLGGVGGGGSTGGFTSGFNFDGNGLILSGARAKGGPVIGGRNYLVGERGAEIFKAPSSGNIVANDDIVGARGDTFNLGGVHVTGGVDLATRTETYRLAGAVKDATIAAIEDRNRRRG